MIASLGWYPATRPVWDRLWHGVRDRLGWGPANLTWSAAPDSLWRRPDLVLSMTCALPMRLRLAADVALVGSPVWDLPGLPPGHYASHLVMRRDDDRTLAQAARAGIAANAEDSQSGFGVLRDTGLTGPTTFTGGHAASMEAVAGGTAHLAAIDAITWAMAPHPELTVRKTTPPTPSTPFITARTDWRGPVRAALGAAIAAMPTADRAAARLIGITDLPAGVYSQAVA